MNKIIAVDFDGTLCEESWPGIGAAKKVALLKRFRSTRGIAKAEVREIASAAGVNETIAAQVKSACAAVGG